jgi:hypothetical protein
MNLYFVNLIQSCKPIRKESLERKEEDFEISFLLPNLKNESSISSPSEVSIYRNGKLILEENDILDTHFFSKYDCLIEGSFTILQPPQKCDYNITITIGKVTSYCTVHDVNLYSFPLSPYLEPHLRGKKGRNFILVCLSRL